MNQRHEQPSGIRFLAKLFWLTFKLSACTFGGGYVIVPLMRKDFVEKNHWISEDEMLNLIALSQSAPGPIAVNASIILGYEMAGIGGSLAATLGTVTPPLGILALVSVFYDFIQGSEVAKLILMGMRAGVAAVLCDAVVKLVYATLKRTPHKLLTSSLMLVSGLLAICTPINVVWIVVMGLISGTGIGIWQLRHHRANDTGIDHDLP